MAKYNSINDVIVGHINALLNSNNLNASDYPYQNDVHSALIQLANVYAAISGDEVPVAADTSSIVGALDALLDVVDGIVTG